MKRFLLHLVVAGVPLGHDLWGAMARAIGLF